MNSPARTRVKTQTEVHPLAPEIIRILQNEGPMTAIAIAATLDAQKADVNRCLYKCPCFKESKMEGIAKPFWSLSNTANVKLRPHLASPKVSSAPGSMPSSGSTSPIYDRSSPEGVSPRVVRHALLTAQMLGTNCTNAVDPNSNSSAHVKDVYVVLVDLGNVPDCTIPLITLMEQQSVLAYKLDAHFFADFGTNPHKGKIAIPNFVKATDTDHNAADLEMVWRAKELADKYPKMSTFIIATKDKGLGYLRTLLTREGQTSLICPDWPSVRDNLPK